MVYKAFAMGKNIRKKLGNRFFETHLLDNLTDDVVNSEKNYLSWKDIFLALVTRNLLWKKVEDDDLSEGQRDKFIEDVAFCRQRLRYTLFKTDVDSSFWEMKQWIDFQFHQDGKWSHVEYFVEKYDGIPQYDDNEMENLFEEFINSNPLSDSELLAAAWEDAIVR